MSPQLRGLYVIANANTAGTTDKTHASDQLLRQISCALKGGVNLVQYRDKTARLHQRIAIAKDLKRLCDKHHVPLFINDCVDTAQAVGTGVHLGHNDGNLADARARLGKDAIIGATCHASLQLAEDAVTQGASYIAFGSCFASRTKPDAQHCPLSIIREARAQFSVPIVAIGGITLENASSLIPIVDMLAVANGVFAPENTAADIQLTCERFGKLFDQAPHRRPSLFDNPEEELL